MITARETEEYRQLRETIRERGTARIGLFAVGMLLWAGLVVATAAVTSTLPLATLLPLLALAALFEAVFALHTGVERIGRYLQVFYEEGEGERRWEHVAMDFGQSRHVSLPDPIFATLFLLATLGNFLPALLAGPVPIEAGVIGALHVMFGVRVILGRRTASRQRNADLARFLELRASAPLALRERDGQQ